MRHLTGGMANISIIVLAFGVITALGMSLWYIVPAGFLGYSIGITISTLLLDRR